MLRTVIQFENKEEPELSSNLKLDLGFFKGNKAVIDTGDIVIDKPKKPRQRKAKTKELDGKTIVLADEEDEKPLYQTNEPYKTSYNETDSMLKTAIGQIDVLQSDIKQDIDMIRASKTLKNKYGYITDMTSSIGTIINTKVSAIRELNKSITDSHNLELRRIKDLKLNENETDDDKHIMDLYNAFVSTPMGNSNNFQLGPSAADMNTQFPMGNIIRADGTNDLGYDSYKNNMNTVQNTMRYENNANIQTVVVYNQSTGVRYFDVIDQVTGNSVPNVSRPDNDFMMEDITINVYNGTARHTKLDITYPLILIGDSTISEY